MLHDLSWTLSALDISERHAGVKKDDFRERFCPSVRCPSITMASYTAVYLDLETTGLSVQQADVIQIGATCGHKKFSRYILPTVPIEAGASDTNGLTICEGRLYKGNQPVPTVSMEQAYEELVTFLSGFPNRVIIVAHNGSKFDFRLLARDLKRVGLLGQLRAAVAGTVDSVPVFQAKLPHWGKYEFRLANMVNRLGVSGHGAHDALRDAEMLETLSQKLNVSVSDLWPYLQPL